MNFYQVALLGLKVPPLTYHSAEDIKLGSLVSVRLKNKNWSGIILKKESVPSCERQDKIKEIGEVIIPRFLSLRNLHFYNFVSRYYFVYPGEVISFALPGIKRSLSFLKEYSNITSGQSSVARVRGFPGVYLFVGKKEEDRIRFLLRKVREGGNILVLVPEIVTGERIFVSLRHCLKDSVVFYHSSLKRKERIENWLKIMAGRARVIIGPKPTVFLPIPNLAGILVEEEESLFYKERERHFHYHARDCAVARGKIEDVPVYLFSHTPSCESFYNCQIGKYKLFGRFKRKKIKVITTNCEAERVLSNQLKRFLINYRKGEKFYLLVQRKGFSRYIICADCGAIPRCLICGFPFFYHQAKASLSCHICKKEERVFEECPNCKGANFLFRGIGTEMVQREIIRNFPHLKLVELEKRKGDFDEKGIFLGTSYALSRFGENHFDLAAIISLEQLLSFPDFRTEERAFQIFHSLITRLKEGGFLIVQTRNSQNRFLGRTFNPPLFYQRLLKERKDCFFPPFSHIIALKIFQEEATAQKKYEEIKKKLAPISGAIVFPPFKSFAKKKGVSPYVILLKLRPQDRLFNLLTRADLREIEVDINPIEILT